MSVSLQHICKHFSSAQILTITALGNGLINDTYLIETQVTGFVLQRLNTQVFPNPELVMENLVLLTQHIKQKKPESTKLKVPMVLKTINNENYYEDGQGCYWRAIELIENIESRETISRIDEAKQVGFALAHFHYLLSDISVDLFHDTLPGFHITPMYYQHYETVENKCNGTGEIDKLYFCRSFIATFKEKINVLEVAKHKGLIKERIIHGDPKLNNFLFKTNSDQIISLIDLDTVKPGLVHYDIGDCLRSCCHISHSNDFDLEICEAILKNYLQNTHGFLTVYDTKFIYPAIQLIPFELGLRFFTDYLEGNRYFKVNSPEQNLYRAINQFHLCESIVEKRVEINEMIADFTSF